MTRLIITQDSPEFLLESAKSLEAEVMLELVFSDDIIELDIPLYYTEKPKSFYLSLDGLNDIAIQTDVSLVTLESAAINGETVELLIAVAEEVVPWSEFISRLSEMTNRPQATIAEAGAQLLRYDRWELTGGAVSWIEDLGEGEGGLGYAYLVVDAESKAVLATRTLNSNPTAEQLVELICQAVVYPMHDPTGAASGRPSNIYCSDITLTEAIAKPLESLGISVHLGDTPLARQVFESLLESMGVGRSPSYFSQFQEEELRQFLAAADTFFDLEPWERLNPNKYVAFRLNGGEWHYCNVMGIMGEEFGLAMFHDWLELCCFVHNRGSFFEMMLGSGITRQLAAVGSVESLSLHEISELHPDDTAYLQTLGLKRETYPLVMHMTKDGILTPRFSSEIYQCLLSGLAEVLASRRAAQISSIKKTLTVGNHTLELRYPAKGDEALTEARQSYRLTISANPYIDGDRLSGVKHHLVIETPGTTTLHKLALALRNAIDTYVTGFGLGFEPLEESEDPFTEMLGSFGERRGALLWSDRNEGHYGPHPRVAQLEGLSDLWLEQWQSYYPMTLERTSTPLPEGEILIDKR